MSVVPRGAEFYAFCEQQLWAPWHQGRLKASDVLEDQFDLEYAPEPYLTFGAGDDPLYVLLTNPGKGLPFQHRGSIRSERSCVTANMRYADASRALAAHYVRHLKKAAGRRIKAMQTLAALLGRDGVVQFECIPFHSARLPGKRTLPRLISACPLLGPYSEHLGNLLAQHPVISLAAVSSKGTISTDVVTKHPWRRWLAGLMGLDLTALELEPLVKKDTKVTCAFAYERRQGRTSGIVLMMGGNHPPGEEGLTKLAQVFARGG